MTERSIQYYDFVKSKGKSLGTINPGSDEHALEVADALQAVKLLESSKMPILGGDILTMKEGSLMYANHLWGSKYHCLNWYCEKMDNESDEDFNFRSYREAREAIKNAQQTAEELGQKCYITLVI